MAPRKPSTSTTESKPRKPRAARTTKGKSAPKPEAGAAAQPSADTEEAPDTLEPEVLEAEVLDAHFADEATPEEESEVEVRSGDEALPVRADPGAVAPTDSLSRYLAEIRSYPILTREEEHEIALRYFVDKDPDAAMRLVTANLRLVVVVAREYQRAFHNLLDLIQEGNVGLLEAVKQFDPYRGVRFPSYAVWWIRAYVIRYVMNNFRLVKVGTTQAQRRLFFNLKKEKARLEALGFTPSAKQIAEHLGVKEKEVIEMDQRLATSSEVSVETPLGHDGGGTVLDLLPAPGHSAEDDVSEGEFYALMKEKIEEFGSRLEGREAEIYRERLVAEDPLTLQELGDRYGVSRERVRQMEAAVKKKLREFLVSQVRDLDEDMVR
jgi:RNA polymerase sigma-32 factor